MKVSSLNKFFRVVFLSLCLWLFPRVFIFQIYTVPTASMNNALMEGDKVFVNKLALGARVPITPLSIHLGNRKFFLDWFSIPYSRLPGYSSIERNDILVFNLPSETQLPVDERKESVKRCIGLPGDIVSIKDGNVFINSKYQQEPSVLKFFSLHTQPEFTDTLCLKKFCHSADAFRQQHFSAILSSSSADSVMRCANVISLKRKIISKDNYSPNYFPNAPQVKWNPDHWGPFYIPKKGQGIYLTKANLILYQSLIEQHEGNTIKFNGDSVFVNNQITDFYVFSMDYYFVLGDNRYNSIDSRYWGLVPENHLIGRAR